MKRKILSVIICLALLASFFAGFTTSVSAAASATLAVYVQRGASGTPVLLHTFTQSEIAALPNVTQYYTAIDNLPTYVQAKGTGITLAELADDVKQYDSYANVTFNSGGSIKMNATDGWTRTFYYDSGTNTGTNFYGLMSKTRYYYPNAYRYADSAGLPVFNHDTSGAIPVEPMLCMYSVWSRSVTVVNDQGVKSITTVPAGTIVTQSVLDDQPIDTSSSFRMCFGLSSDEEANEVATAPAHGYWVNQVKYIMQAYDVTIGSGITGGTVTSNAACTGASAGDTVTLTVAPDSGNQLSTLTASYNSGQTLKLTQGTGNTYSFTMPAYAVTIKAFFTPSSEAPFWDLNGDDKCNLDDAVVIGNHWGETGKPGWIQADVNLDGVINLGDVVTVGLHWGDTR